SILFHEISHSVVGRRYGMQIEGITLWIFGGIAEMTKDADKPSTEFLMAAAGPAASFVLAGLFYLTSFGLAALQVPITVVGVIGYLAWLNLILAIFNLIPAFPLDGGRILRSALWRLRGIVSATRISSGIGNGFGWLLIILGILAALAGNPVGGIWWVLIGSFVRFAAKASLRQFMATRLLSKAPVDRLMDKNPPKISPDASVYQFVDELAYTTDGGLYPVGRNGIIEGVVDMDAIRRLPRSEWKTRTIGEFTSGVPGEAVIEPEADAAVALERLQRTGRRGLAVARDGHVEGLLSMEDLERYLRRRAAMEDELSRQDGARAPRQPEEQPRA
ncbi:MAG: site-2 protease family protein, partial [Myxococcota bacterium]